MNAKELTTVTQIEFEVKDRMVVADPCYIDLNDVDENGKVQESGLFIVIDDCAGKWVAEIDTENTSWGNRVSVLRLKHQDRNLNNSRFIAINDNGVDSGQMYAGCLSDTPLDYDALMDAYEGDHSKKILAFGGGVVSSTGYGDGCYPVYVAYTPDDLPAVIEVRFIEE